MEVRGKSLAELSPDLAKHFSHELNKNKTPDTVGSSTIVWWKCKNGHGWEKEIIKRTKTKSGALCPECAKNNR